MGNNQAYSSWEDAVMGLARIGCLTKATLTAVSEPYRGTDIDSGGCQDLTLDTTVEQCDAASLLASLRDIAGATDADDESSYRADDREGCLDYVHGKAKEASVCLILPAGATAEDCAILVMGGTIPPKPDLPKNYNKWTEAQRDANDNYNDAKYNLFNELVSEPFGWR